jgi:hypothetical protein
MNREEWNKLSEESKWKLANMKFITKFEDITGNIITKAFVESIEKLLQKEDTREDNSEECFYSVLQNCWVYINPFNRKQVMYSVSNGFQVKMRTSDWESTKDEGNKSVWQKVESVNELKVGDFIRMYDKADDKYKENLKGILINKNGIYISYQYFNEDGVHFNKWEFDEWVNVEKAVLVEE